MNRGLIKKAAAVMLSITLAFGAVSVLPGAVVKDNAIVASAAQKDRSKWSSVKLNDCDFFYSFTEKNGVKSIIIEDCDILNDTGTVKIPEKITHDGVVYPVTTLGYNLLIYSQDIREFIMPDSITDMSYNVLWCSSVEKITISDNVGYIGLGFAYGCPNLKREDVKYNGSKIASISRLAFADSPLLLDENGAFCIKNWLVRYDPKNSPKQVKITDLGNDGMKIDHISENGINAKTLQTVDLEGITYVGVNAFSDHPLLNTVLNYDSSIILEEKAFDNTPWLFNDKVNGTGIVLQTKNCSVYCDHTTRTGKDTLEVIKAFNFEDTVVIPATADIGGTKYTVTDVAADFLRGDTKVKTVEFPTNVTKISENVLRSSSVENITLPNGLRELGAGFASNCSNLKYDNVTYDGLKLENVDSTVFASSPWMRNSYGAVSLGNWLIKYTPLTTTVEARISELGNGDNVIENITDNAIGGSTYVLTLDLENVKRIGKNNFNECPNIGKIKNDEGVTEVGENSLDQTLWYSQQKETGLVKLGSVLLYYKNNDNTIDLTKDGLKDIKNVQQGAFADCENADTLICTSDTKLSENCFYVATEGNSTAPRDTLPNNSTYKIKNITLDGKKLEFSKSSPVMPEWVKENFDALEGSEWVKINAEAKMKAVFGQLSIPYYGLANEKTGKLSATQEFYNVLKAHEYISTYDLDKSERPISAVGSFLTGAKMGAAEYADLTHYMLECSGVEYRSLVGPTYRWDSAKIGEEWFENDAGLDQQNGHGYGWFALSSAKIDAMDNADSSADHRYSYSSNTWHEFYGNYVSLDRPEADRILGDLNGDNVRDRNDVTLIWNYINGKGSVDKKLGDINFDGKIDVKDGVLLDAFVNNTSVDPKKYSKNGLAPGFNVAFVNGKDYSSIKYQLTDADGYIVLPSGSMFSAPKGKVFDGWNIGKAGEKVKISDPYTVIQPKWKNDMLLGDVDGNNVIDISDVSKLINHINGVKALNSNEMLRADTNKSKTVDISDASAIVNHINGVKALNGTV